jgi:hypothetical protein
MFVLRYFMFTRKLVYSVSVLVFLLFIQTLRVLIIQRFTASGSLGTLLFINKFENFQFLQFLSNATDNPALEVQHFYCANNVCNFYYKDVKMCRSC